VSSTNVAGQYYCHGYGCHGGQRIRFWELLMQNPRGATPPSPTHAPFPPPSPPADSKSICHTRQWEGTLAFCRQWGDVPDVNGGWRRGGRSLFQCRLSLVNLALTVFKVRPSAAKFRVNFQPWTHWLGFCCAAGCDVAGAPCTGTTLDGTGGFCYTPVNGAPSFCELG